MSCDFSENMVNLISQQYEEGDYKHIPGNKYKIDATTDYTQLTEDGQGVVHKCPLDDIIKEQGDFKRFVFGCRANNERLPFPSDYFESYIANLSLFIVDNPKNMIFESFRVLKKGGAACFALWGPKERSIQFTVVEEAIEKYITPEQV